MNTRMQDAWRPNIPFSIIFSIYDGETRSNFYKFAYTWYYTE